MTWFKLHVPIYNTYEIDIKTQIQIEGKMYCKPDIYMYMYVPITQ